MVVPVEGASGLVEVSGLLLRPRKANALLVLGHGAGAGMHHPFLEDLAQALAARDVATFRYQFPYMESGRHRPDHPTRLVRTVRAAVDRARRATRGLPILVGGKSMGGRISSLAEARDPLGVRGVVFFGFPLQPPRDDGTKAAQRAEPLQRIETPMLFLQGTRDALAPLDSIQRLCRDLGRRAMLHVVEGADHGFHVLKRSGRNDEEILVEIADATARWIDGIVGGRE